MLHLLTKSVNGLADAAARAQPHLRNYDCL